MREMKKHVASGAYVDYYYCSECGWVYPFPRFVKQGNEQSTNYQMAEREFADHDCSKHPSRSPR